MEGNADSMERIKEEIEGKNQKDLDGIENLLSLVRGKSALRFNLNFMKERNLFELAGFVEKEGIAKGPYSVKELSNHLKNPEEKGLLNRLEKYSIHNRFVFSLREFASIIPLISRFPCYIDSRRISFTSVPKLKGRIQKNNKGAEFRLFPSHSDSFIVLEEGREGGVWLFDFKDFYQIPNIYGFESTVVGKLLEGVYEEKDFEKLLTFAEKLRNMMKIDLEGFENCEKISPKPLVLLEENEGMLKVQLLFSYSDPPVYISHEQEREFVAANGNFYRRDKEKEDEWAEKFSSIAGKGTLKILHPESALVFLDGQVPRLIAGGFEVHGIPLLKRYRLEKARVNIRLSSGIEWFTINIDAEAGDRKLSLDEIKKITEKGQEYVFLENFGWVKVEYGMIEKLKKIFEHSILERDALKVSKYRIMAIENILSSQYADTSSRELYHKIERRELPRSLQELEGFKGELKPHQESGLSWLLFLHENNFGGILADDMGLGKTVQVLALLSVVKQRPNLIIAPSSVVPNWEKEIKRFTNLTCTVLEPGKRNYSDIHNYDIVLTTYGVLRKDIETLSLISFKYAILDESQFIKNPFSSTAIAARKIASEHKLAITGTPIENSLVELFSQFSFINPSLFGSFERFSGEFSGPIKRNDGIALEKLKILIKPFILRRTKAKIKQNIAPKQEYVIWCSLAPKQKALYDSVFSSYRGIIREKLAKEGINNSRFAVLEALLRLRQLCLHPKLAGIPGSEIEESGKLEEFHSLLDSIIKEKHRTLVFSQFTSLFPFIKKQLEEKRITYSYLDGSTKDRSEVVDSFKQGSEQVFLISLKAGGTGLNLTEANCVILLDPWWNPAVEQQAMDRVHRIGQEKPVFVYKLVAEGTIEEKMLELQETKKKLASEILGDNIEGALTEEDIRKLFEI